jgi:hypothetical protein
VPRDWTSGSSRSTNSVLPRLVDLRTDPFERAIDESANYDTWLIQHIFPLYPVRDYARAFYQTFIEFPPRQPAGPVGRIRDLIELLSKVGQ